MSAAAGIPERLQPIVAACFEPTLTTHGASRIGEWWRCPWAHHLHYNLKVVPVFQPNYFALGTLVHAALAYVGEGARIGDSERAWQHAIRYAETQGTDVEVVVDAERILSAYFAHYSQVNGGYDETAEILAIETEYSRDSYTARADAVLKDAYRVIIVDHKTRGRPLPRDIEEYKRELATRPQFIGLAWLVQKAMALSTPPSIMVNVIIKSKVPSFARLDVEISQAAIDEWLKHREPSDMSLTQRNYYACAPEGHYRCQYFQHCHGSDEERERYYKVES